MTFHACCPVCAVEPCIVVVLLCSPVVTCEALLCNCCAFAPTAQTLVLIPGLLPVLNVQQLNAVYAPVACCRVSPQQPLLGSTAVHGTAVLPPAQ